MKLFLIRHGETVDNVAKVYAGDRDSALTSHGVLQAERLGRHLASRHLNITYLFSSDLQRAYKTAEAIKEAVAATHAGTEVGSSLTVTRLPLLREKGFGRLEGQRFGASSPPDRQVYVGEVESKSAVCARANRFLDEHLVPLVRAETALKDVAMVIVAHGCLNMELWRCFLQRFVPSRLSATPGVIEGDMPSHYFGGWSNTGYLELDVDPSHAEETSPVDRVSTAHDEVDLSPQSPFAGIVPDPDVKSDPLERASSNGLVPDAKSDTTASGSSHDVLVPESKKGTYLTHPMSHPLKGWRLLVKTYGSTSHLEGLQRTRGGVGSSKHDDAQPKIDGFFKKRKLGVDVVTQPMDSKKRVKAVE